MSLVHANTGHPSKPFLFHTFSGIDTSKDPSALDTGENQAFISAVNCHIDWRGVVHNDPAAVLRGGTTRAVLHNRFYGRDMLAWAEVRGEEAWLVADSGAEATEPLARNVPISSVAFNRRAIFAQRDSNLQSFDGDTWKVIKPAKSRPQASIVSTVQRRLVLAGLPGADSELWFSRVDREDVFHPDEEPGSADVTKGVKLDVRNLIDASDAIKGVAAFDSNRLAIFTNDRVLVYNLDPDYTKWAYDDKAVIRVGTISHNTICEVGGDLFFCSRMGIHSIRRSALNGVTMYTVPLSFNVTELYRKMLKRVADPEQVSAVYDPDGGKYNIFFPIQNGTAERLTLSLNPVTQEGGETTGRWTTGNYLGAQCAAFSAGQLTFGTPYGNFDVLDLDDSSDARPVAQFVTPIFWHENINEPKQSLQLSVQASGRGEVLVEAWDETGRGLGSTVFPVGETAGQFPDIPLIRQFARPFQHRYRGVSLRFTIKSTDHIKINGFAIEVRKA